MKSSIIYSILNVGLLLLLCVPRVYSQLILVPNDQPTIQAAINAAENGDTVLVMEGTYYENLNFAGKAITVGSNYITDGDTSHVSATIIDGSQPSNEDTSSVVVFISGEDSTSVLSGFTITGGTGSVFEDEDFQTARGGGGIFIWNASPKIENNRIINNRVEGSDFSTGGGLLVYRDDGPSAVILRKNIIKNNVLDAVQQASGGGMALSAVANIEDNEFRNNRSTSPTGMAIGGAIAAEEYDLVLSVKVMDNILVNNEVVTQTEGQPSAGGAIYSNISDLYLLGNQIAGNKIAGASDDLIGAGAFILPISLDGTVVITDNLFSQNHFSGNSAIGGALVVIDANTLDIRGNRFDKNRASNGAGIILLRTKAQIYNNVFYRNISDYTAGGIHIERSNVMLSGNMFWENQSSLGGGVYAYESSPVIRRNIFYGNEATEGGGGIMAESWYTPITYQNIKLPPESLILMTSSTGRKYLDKIPRGVQEDHIQTYYGDAKVMNNTFVRNKAHSYLGGGGVNALFSGMDLVNNIFWENDATDGPQIEGSVNAQYNLVPGGFAGTGNIDGDPMFADDSLFYLESSSAAVDSGHPDAMYYDVEDPGQPGRALYPSMGSLRNDMGAWGGPVDYVEPEELLGPVFRAFIKEVTTASPTERQGMVDEFMQSRTQFPFIETNNVVYYLYQGTANRVTVPGDANNWDPDAFPMTHLTLTDLWYREAVYESDARLDYKFVVDGNTWLLDPLNPNQVVGGYGPNSELAMPDYVQPPEIQLRDGIPYGTLNTHTMTSELFSNQRTIQVYTPPGYENAPDKTYPMVLMHDGLEFVTLASANVVLDNLIADQRIQPLIMVFVPPKDRDNEYAFTKTALFEQFVLDELMPFVEERYRIKPGPENHAMGGISFGGLISAQICYHHPEIFGNSIWMSAAFWPEEKAVLQEILNGETKELKIYVDWGTYETGIMVDGRLLRRALADKGYAYNWREWHDGHSWGNWRAHLDIALEFLYPGNAVHVDEVVEIPQEFMLYPNYPNPFNPTTTIAFALPQSSNVKIMIFDITGRLITTLVDATYPAGKHTLSWYAGGMASGLYIYRLETSSTSITRKMMLLK